MFSPIDDNRPEILYYSTNTSETISLNSSNQIYIDVDIFETKKLYKESLEFQY